MNLIEKMASMKPFACPNEVQAYVAAVLRRAAGGG